MTPLHEQLRDLADLSQDPRRLLIEAADRLELVEGLYEDQVEITRNWKLAADARWDRIKRLEEFVDQLTNPKFTRDDLPIKELLQRIKRLEEAGDAMVLYATTPTKTAWKQAKEAKP